MAELALTLPIVIASPGDVAQERDLLERAIDDQRRRAAQNRLLLEPVRWEKSMRPTIGRPQAAFNDEHLRRAELIVFVFWSSLGSAASASGPETGTLEELRLAQSLVRSGSSDDIFMYFRSGTTKTSGESAVAALRGEIRDKKLATFFDYGKPADLRALFERHLSQWLDRWIGVPAICEDTMWSVPPRAPAATPLRENRLHRLLLHFDLESHQRLASWIGKQAVQMYQRYGTRAYGLPLDLGSAKPEGVQDLVEPRAAPPSSWSSIVRTPDQSGTVPFVEAADGAIQFSDPEWLSFFCAIGLFDAIMEGRYAAVERYPYNNEVHQYLAALVERQAERRPRIVECLSEWLARDMSAGRGRPVVRNFAAYVLGMITATEAEDALAEAAAYDEGDDVRTYAVCALGKLRSRRHLGVLVRLRGREKDDRQRTLIGQAICRITGVAHYEL